MESNNGYIKLHRSIVDWEWYKDPNTARVFLHLLLIANWEDKKWQGQEIKRGQVIVTRRGLAKTLGITERSVRTSLEHLKSTHEVTLQPTQHWTLVTIVNYEKYQGVIAEPTQPTTNGATNDRPTTDPRPTHTNNYKNNKKDNNSFIYDPPILKPDDEEFRRIVEEGKERLRRKEWI